MARPPKIFAVFVIHCGQFILRKISKFDATTCQILRLLCTKFDFNWSSAPDPAGGAYSALPDLLAVFKGPTSKDREGKRRGQPPQIFWPRTAPGQNWSKIVSEILQWLTLRQKQSARFLERFACESVCVFRFT